MKTQKTRNQRHDVLEYMIEHGSITQLDAYKKFPAPITRLSAVIYDLRKMGADIEGDYETSHNCYGANTYKRYKLNNPEFFTKTPHSEV